jgi:hypothetical protein
MLGSYLIAAAFLMLILSFWVLVQIGWRRVFGCRGADPDVLAGRMSCGGDCGHDEN